ncbi:DUF5305 family protein [Psychrobacillus glaciei]|uniref:DUF5305 family protein n=1 Tax=Psychrobacillus glaciei TaxID=2283160 RepID=UPI00178C2684|nr:DUF5305 family protein [Psychrobacillus glaciei]
MKEVVEKLLKRDKKKVSFILLLLLTMSAIISVYSWSMTSSDTTQINENVSQIQSSYDYKATLIPNILYPKGGTVEVGNTIMKKVTKEIPFTLLTTINSGVPVSAKVSHEVNLLLRAGEYWERSFPLEQKKTFEKTGAEVSIINGNYKIDLEMIKNFITKVEDETGVRADKYTMEIVPNVQGTISYNGTVKDIQMEDHLIFQLSYDEILLASEKEFASSVPFISTKVSSNTISLFGFDTSPVPVRITSTVFVLLFVVLISYLNKDFMANRKRIVPSQGEKIIKKYGNRLIPVSNKVEIDRKSIVTLNSFKAIIQIADAKELPIFYYESKLYFIIDGDYMYQYEINEMELSRSRSRSRSKNSKDETESDPSYALE